jgi:hypothetical protein
MAASVSQCASFLRQQHESSEARPERERTFMLIMETGSVQQCGILRGLPPPSLERIMIMTPAEVDLVGTVMEARATLTAGTVTVGPHA